MPQGPPHPPPPVHRQLGAMLFAAFAVCPPQRLQNTSDTPRGSLLPQSQHKGVTARTRVPGVPSPCARATEAQREATRNPQGLGAPAGLPPQCPGLGRSRQRPFFEAFRQSPGFRPQPTGKHPPRQLSSSAAPPAPLPGLGLLSASLPEICLNKCCKQMEQSRTITLGFLSNMHKMGCG